MKKNQFKGKSAVITGASRGIGKATALEFVRSGGSVCIIARDKTALDETSRELRTHRSDNEQYVQAISADCTCYDELKPLLEKHIRNYAVPDFLFNFVGYACPDYIENLTHEDFRKNMDINYYGQLIPLLVILPYFMERGGGHVINCSSVAGYLGVMGYSAYTPTKFAIAGLTESLRHELKPLNIQLSILYPPDTDTPGFQKENETKPEELLIISEGGGLLRPENVARKLLAGVSKKKFYIHPGQSRLLWTLVRHFPKLSHFIIDGELKKARKKTRATA